MTRRALPALVLSLASLPACFGLAEPDKQAAPLARGEGRGTFWVERTDAELATALGEACAAAVAQDQPVLLWVSASWCGDCRRHLAHEKAGHMDAELAHWQRVVIEPGRFDRHTELLQTFEVSAVPYAIATRPTDCAQPATAWPVLDKGRFDRPVIDGDTDRLEEWMRDARGG